MGLLNDSVSAISQAGQAGADAARTQTGQYLTNQATKYGLQEGVGQLAGIGLGYVANKQKIPPLTPEHSKIAGTTVLHAMKEWHPVYDSTAQPAATSASLGAPTAQPAATSASLGAPMAQPAATSASLGAPTGGYDLSGGGNG